MLGENQPENSQSYENYVKQSHCSWLINNALFTGKWKTEEKHKAVKAAKLLGYELHISAYKFKSGKLYIKMTNNGTAPFYYSWPIFVTDSKSGKTQKTTWDITTVLPGNPVIFSTDCKWDNVSFSIPNPMKGGKEIKFANEMNLLLN